jgi:cyclophilin family peptidyl-prolyl cis-trans isomerase
MNQGGDITKGNGSGGESIYGGRFADEGFVLQFEGPMELAMANSGPDTNSSQFFITTAATTWLNGKHTLFGRVLEGENVVQAMERVGTHRGAVLKQVIVTDSGELPL